MELVELSTTSLAEAMFDRLGLPKPVYRVHQLENGGYKAQIQFYHAKESSHTSPQQTRLSSPICQDREESKNHATDLAIEYMETIEKKVLVDYNYYQLEQQKKAFARVSERSLEKSKHIKQQDKTIKEITTEASKYVEKVRSATNKIHDLPGGSSGLADSMSVHDLRKAILEIRVELLPLQNATETTCLSQQQDDMYPSDSTSDPGYIGFSGEGSDEDYHQDMDDDYGHYVRSRNHPDQWIACGALYI